MMNLKLVEGQPHWRIWIVAWFARLMGALIHVEGIPFGSSRVYRKRRKAAGETASAREARDWMKPSSETES